jgi:hypothetical protein
MMSRSILPLAAICVLLAACGSHEDSDQLAAARKRLHPRACASSPAVAAVSGVNEDAHAFYLGDWIVVSVCNLDQLVKSADAAQAPITLFIEGQDSGNEPTGIDLESGTLTFILDRNDRNRGLWKPYLYNPLFDPEVSMRVSVGIKGERPLPRVPGANMTIRLHKLYTDWTTVLWALLFATLAIVLITSAIRTNMLREQGAYSLGRTQMAWWFFLIVVSYVFIWMVTGDRDTLPPSVLGLMGISAATAMVAAAMPGNPNRPASRGWKDLISGDDGNIALDRLQVVVWTLILGIIFLMSVLWDLSMPEFNATLLALMGISSGTYLGFKLPQTNKSSE